MVELTEFQKKRQENIKRNNDLLQKLNLTNKASEIKREAGVLTEDEKRRKKKKIATSKPKRNVNVKKEKSPTVPVRRSRRLRGESVDTDGIPNVNDNQLFKLNGNGDVKLESSPEDDQVLKDMKVIGDVKLSDLLKEGDDDNALLDKFKSFSSRPSDFFNELKKYRGNIKLDAELETQLKEFDLNLYDIFQPNEIKIVYERISAIYFHPSIEKKLVVAGDISGNVGLWNVRDEPIDDELLEPEITRFKLFNKNVGRIDCFPTNSSKLLATSYDGSIRSIDLSNLESEDLLILTNEYDDALGVSDCQFSYDDPNVLFVTTLSGEFTTLDMRMKKGEFNNKLKRLSDKKIGSMSINPNRPYEIATGSLDRTLKLWDIRKIVNKPDWSQYEDFPSHEIVSTYDSRLSVSAVSYSPTDNTLVCNGYDDTIRLFDVTKPSEDLQPKLTLKHNCQTGRWTSILKARFKPNKNVFAIANMSRAIDIYNSDGQQLAHLNTATVPAVVSWHPLRNWIVGGNSSGKVFLFQDDSNNEDTL
ncbi:Cmr1p NDAI_0A01990 [Naumovozyma dairenensis CBS 421]|uniref:DNA damage-binding protein CMR1 n=1 Tax=Naumovozyma dairenensis (strain ATCC 10597 / BCRC 20456 / CBS 421 / NBRC 0211 / NRRL Y-12639) TaxID=1071378 RepID=G0W3G9_NAUDC|nr:hypothetical protein NDAI_0A01990 [Naumovozyma dairenensis CBS 421]CCD22357.1 hypothetical protein NDAI_0A01990 [Naumovozyma dairenensis CBS 421]